MKSILPPTERFRTTRVGAMAVSGVRTSTARKATSNTAKVTRRPIIRDADQGKVLPPYWRAKMRHTMDGTRNKSPRGSRRLSWSRTVSFSRGSELRWRNRNMATKVKPPMGRLM